MKTKKYYICVTPFFPSTDNWRGAYVYDQVKAIMRNSDYEVVVMKPTSWRDQTEAYYRQCASLFVSNCRNAVLFL